MRCKIVLACAGTEVLTGKQIAERVGCGPATVSKWRKRFAEHRLDGLIDEPRPHTGHAGRSARVVITIRSQRG